MLGFGSLGQFSLGEYVVDVPPIAPVIPGGSSASTGDVDRRNRDPRQRRGLVPPKWMPPVSAPRPPPPPLPPFREQPLPRPDGRLPSDLVEPDLVPDVLWLQNEILAAHEAYRRQSEQDSIDIADVIAILERTS